MHSVWKVYQPLCVGAWQALILHLIRRVQIIISFLSESFRSSYWEIGKILSSLENTDQDQATCLNSEKNPDTLESTCTCTLLYHILVQ